MARRTRELRDTMFFSWRQVLSAQIGGGPMTHRARRRGIRMLAYVVFSLLGICMVRAASTQGPPLPDPAEVFVVTFEPTRYPNMESPYFSADELIRSLATFQPIDDRHDAR